MFKDDDHGNYVRIETSSRAENLDDDYGVLSHTAAMSPGCDSGTPRFNMRDRRACEAVSTSIVFDLVADPDQQRVAR